MRTREMANQLMSISGPSKIVEQVGVTFYEDEITKYKIPIQDGYKIMESITGPL
jgi:hypothetical protein